MKQLSKLGLVEHLIKIVEERERCKIIFEQMENVFNLLDNTPVVNRHISCLSKEIKLLKELLR